MKVYCKTVQEKMNREFIYECVKGLDVPLEIKEDNMSYSERCRLEICRDLYYNRATKVYLSVFDKDNAKIVQEFLSQLAIKYSLSVQYLNEVVQ